MTVALATPAPSGSKGWFRGTHRACAPEETWERITPLLRAAGVTRVGELTRLDTPGVPVFQAVRPASHTLSVTLGAGLSPVLARVSAAMASLELWHAEHVASPPNWSAVGEVRANLGYNPYTLPLRRHHLLNDGMVLDWVPATVLLSGRPSMVPRQCAEYDLRIREEWSPPVFVSSAHGLACGNTQAEAVLHALCELVALDSLAAANLHPLDERIHVDAATVDHDDARRLLDRLHGAGAEVTILDVTGATGVPAFEAVVESQGQAAHGVAAHLDRDVALCRALVIAARERLAQVTGARDDLPVPGADTRAGLPPAPARRTPPRRAYTDIRTMSTASFAGDVAEVADRIRRAGAGPVLVVDLTRDDAGLPAVRVVVPGLRHPDAG